MNQYILEMRLQRDKKIGLFMSRGGFDEERHLESMVKKAVGKGARVVGIASIKRSAIRDGIFRNAPERSCRELLSELPRTPAP